MKQDTAEGNMTTRAILALLDHTKWSTSREVSRRLKAYDILPREIWFMVAEYGTPPLSEIPELGYLMRMGELSYTKTNHCTIISKIRELTGKEVKYGMDDYINIEKIRNNYLYKPHHATIFVNEEGLFTLTPGQLHWFKGRDLPERAVILWFFLDIRNFLIARRNLCPLFLTEEFRIFPTE